MTVVVGYSRVIVQGVLAGGGGSCSCGLYLLVSLQLSSSI